MNIAAGDPLERGKYLKDFEPKEYLLRLMNEKFNGYVCISIHGKTGIEEGVIVLHNGLIVSSDYEYFRYNKRVKGNEGIKRCLNAFLSGTGIVDSFSLSPYQVQLILTLNEDCALTTKIEASTLALPSTFSQAYEDEQVALAPKPVEEMTRDVLLKKYGISKLAPPKVTRTGLLETAKKEHEDVKKLLGVED
jgi:hypothetical protein